MWDQCSFSSWRGLTASASNLHDGSSSGKDWPESCPGMVEVVYWRLVHRLRRGPDMTEVPKQVLFLAGGKGYVQPTTIVKCP